MPDLKNMEQLPAAVQEDIRAFVHSLAGLHGDNLVSVMVYGSAAGTGFVPGVSDVNVAAVFKTLDAGVFRKSLGLIRQSRRRRITAPLFWTEDFIRRSCDVFPIELSDMKHHHIVVLGADLLAGLTIDPAHMRLLCEAQLKGKLLRIRQAYLEAGGDTRVLRHILTDSLNSLLPVFREALRLKHEEPAADKKALLEQCGRVFSFDPSPLLAIHHHKTRSVAIPLADADAVLWEYLERLRIMASWFDAL